MIRLFVKDYVYSDWEYKVEGSSIPLEEFPTPLRNPIHDKLLNNDLLSYDNNLRKYVIVHSPMRTAKYLAGVIILEYNQTFGRTKNRKRLLYKCIPDDKHLPHFLVPYDIVIDFSKSYSNKYVLFKYQEWDDKHPIGVRR